MIQIDPKNIKKIEHLHLAYCKPYILSCIKFCNDFFDRVEYGRITKLKQPLLSKEYEISADTIKFLVKPFLQKKYEKSKIGEIQEFLSKKTATKIAIRIPQFNQLKELLKRIEMDVDEILIASPKELNNVIGEKVYKAIKSIENGKELVCQILNYEKLSGSGFESTSDKSTWGSYTLTTVLEVNVCPYCNRNWINTVGVQNKKVTNPQLDHYFDKASYPVLRLSLYNLIPSCETCNVRTKGKEKMIYEEHLHPYEAGYGKNIKFQTFAKDVDSCYGIANNYDIKVNKKKEKNKKLKKKAKKNHKLFKIDEIYQYHGDIVAEVYQKKYLYSVDYLEMLKENIKGPLNADQEDIYRLAFSNYLREEDFNKRPFSKLTKDTARQLGMVKDD